MPEDVIPTPNVTDISNRYQICTVLDPKLDTKLKDDIKYQDITYYRSDGKKDVKSKDRVHIDFIKAVQEMEELDWNHEDRFIGFDNHKNGEVLQFKRYSENDWYAETPINGGIKWDGYFWGCHAKTTEVINAVRLFFEEMPWSDTLPFTMGRDPKYTRA